MGSERVATLTYLHWAAVLLAAVPGTLRFSSGILHATPTMVFISFAFFAVVALLLISGGIQELYLAGTVYLSTHLVGWYAEDVQGFVGGFDVAVQAGLVVVLVYLYLESRGSGEGKHSGYYYN